jgi:hypothetical protein
VTSSHSARSPAGQRDRSDLRRRAAAVREIPLETVLASRGATRDPADRSKWHTERGPVSVTGAKFTNWTLQRGGGGAIDLVMQLAKLEFLPALEWLEQRLGTTTTMRAAPPSLPSSRNNLLSSSDNRRSSPSLLLPPRDDRQLPRVRRYLLHERRLPASLIDSQIDAGKIYADTRSNAVFLLVSGKQERPVGAELRGTGPHVWRGMAPGTNKDAGYFWTGRVRSREIVICESAIDAISCSVIFPERICLSTAGARSNPPWLKGLLLRDYTIHCGFDADATGDDQAAAMSELHPQVRRLRPTSHDWNDVLKVRRQRTT